MDAVFCTKCTQLFDNWPTLGGLSTRTYGSRPGSEGGWEHTSATSYSTFELEGSARSGCRSCSFMLQTLEDYDLLDTFRKIEMRLIRLGSPAKCLLSIQNWGSNPAQCLWLSFPSKECTSCNGGIALRISFTSRFLPISGKTPAMSGNFRLIVFEPIVMSIAVMSSTLHAIGCRIVSRNMKIAKTILPTHYLLGLSRSSSIHLAWCWEAMSPKVRLMLHCHIAGART